MNPNNFRCLWACVLLYLAILCGGAESTNDKAVLDSKIKDVEVALSALLREENKMSGVESDLLQKNDSFSDQNGTKNEEKNMISDGMSFNKDVQALNDAMKSLNAEIDNKNNDNHLSLDVKNAMEKLMGEYKEIKKVVTMKGFNESRAYVANLNKSKVEFERNVGKVTLTEEGENYKRAICTALGRLIDWTKSFAGEIGGFHLTTKATNMTLKDFVPTLTSAMKNIDDALKSLDDDSSARPIFEKLKKGVAEAFQNAQKSNGAAIITLIKDGKEMRAALENLKDSLEKNHKE